MIECKIEPVADGTYNNDTGIHFTTNSDCDALNIVLDVYQDADGNNFFDWTSNIGIDGVFAKARGGNFYWYTNPDDPDAPGEIEADDGLHAPANPSGKYPGLSHISFCWDPDPDLKVTKVAADSPISAGDVASFTITVENHGEASAHDVELSDTLPTTTGGWTLGGADASDCEIVSDVLSCDFGTLAPGDTRVITVSTTTTADECGALNNLVSVSASNEPDDLLTDNTDSDSIQVDCPDVKVTKTAADSTINAGDVASFTITTENHGDGNAYDVTLSDTLPTTTGGWTLGGADAADCEIVSDVLSCDFGTLASGDTRVITVSTTTTVDECGTLYNLVTVSASNEPGDLLSDNTDNDSVQVDCPDVKVLKTAVDSEVTIEYGDVDGETVAFQIDVTNDGPGSAYDVTLTDTLPGTGWSVSGTDAADCSIVAGTDDALTCDFGTLADGDVKTVIVSRTATRPDDCGTLPNTAVVSASNEASGDTGNNESSDTITVYCPVVEAGEGCTPGYWKQEHHFDSWVTYSPSDELGSIFDLSGYPAYEHVTLIEALNGPDGSMTSLDQLLRHAAAALLNAASSVDYPYTVAEVIAMTNAALASGDFGGTKDLFDMANNLGCPLN